MDYSWGIAIKACILCKRWACHTLQRHVYFRLLMLYYRSHLDMGFSENSHQQHVINIYRKKVTWWHLNIAWSIQFLPLSNTALIEVYEHKCTSINLSYRGKLIYLLYRAKWRNIRWHTAPYYKGTTSVLPCYRTSSTCMRPYKNNSLTLHPSFVYFYIYIFIYLFLNLYYIYPFSMMDTLSHITVLIVLLIQLINGVKRFSYDGKYSKACCTILSVKSDRNWNHRWGGRMKMWT